MAGAYNETTSAKSYYNLSYGYFSCRKKSEPQGLEEIGEDTIKKLSSDFKKVDLRKRFLKKDGEYPFVVFYEKMKGKVVGITFPEIKQGFPPQIALEVIDNDGDKAIINIAKFSKYAENLFNRLVNSKLNLSQSVVLAPYHIPSEGLDDKGKTFNFNNQGVALYDAENNKIQPFYTKEDPKDLPEIELIKNKDGGMDKSRVARMEFLYAKFQERLLDFQKTEQNAPAEIKPTQPAISTNGIAPEFQASAASSDDLPF